MSDSREDEEKAEKLRDAALTRALTKPHKIQKSDKPGKKVAKKAVKRRPAK